MQLSLKRGKLVTNPFAKAFEFGPNLDIIPKVSAAYEQAAEEDEPNRDHILRAHRNFLRDAIYFLYEHNRVANAAYWFQYTAQHYPDKTMLDGKTNSFPRNLTVDKYSVARVQEDVGETSPDRVKAAIEGLLVNSYRSLTVDEDERAAGFKLLARQVWNAYMEKIPKERTAAIGLPPLDDINREMLNRLLDPERGVSREERDVLRTKLGLEKEKAIPAPPTNAPPEKILSTNKP